MTHAAPDATASRSASRRSSRGRAQSARRDGGASPRRLSGPLATGLTLLLVLVTAGGTTSIGPAASAPSSDPDVRSLLRRAEARYDSLSTLRASFTQTIEMRVFEPARRKEGSGTWYQKGRGRFRMDFGDPEGDLIVADGRHVWLYYPSSQPGQVVRTDVAGRGRGSEMVDLQGHIFEQARTAYRPTYGGRDEVGGTAAHLVTLDPPETSPYRVVRVWIDTSTLLVRRLQFEDRSETVRTITLSDLRPGVAVPDSLFEFEPPPDVEVFEG